MILLLLSPLILNLCLDYFWQRCSFTCEQKNSFSFIMLFFVNTLYIGLEIFEPLIWVASLVVGAVLLRKELDSIKKLLVGLAITLLQPLVGLAFGYGAIVLTLVLTFSVYLYLKEKKLSSFAIVLSFSSALTLFDIQPLIISLCWSLSLFSSLYVLIANSNKNEAFLATVVSPLFILFSPVETFYNSELLRVLIILLILLKRGKNDLLISLALFLLIPINVNENPSFVGMLLPTLFFTTNAFNVILNQVLGLERNMDGRFVFSGFEISLLILTTLFLIGLPFTPGSYLENILSTNFISQIGLVFFILISTLETNKNQFKQKDTNPTWFSFIPLSSFVFYAFITYLNESYAFNFYFLVLYIILITIAFLEKKNHSLKKFRDIALRFFEYDYPGFRFYKSPDYIYQNKHHLRLIDVKTTPVRDPIFIVISTLGFCMFICWRLL